MHAYVTFIRPLIEYCSPIWGAGLNVKLKNKIVSCEKKCLSIICRKWVNRDNYVSVLEDCKLDGIEKRRESATIKDWEKANTLQKVPSLPAKIQLGN